MKWTVGTKIGAGFALALAALMTIGVVAYRSTASLLDASEWKTHTYVVLGDLDSLVGQMVNAETGQRGFIITGQDEYLEPYNTGSRAAGQIISDLRKLTADNPNQQRRLDAIEPLVASKLDELKLTIDLRRSKGFDAALSVVQSGKGKQAMDNIRKVVADMESEERDLLKVRDQRATADAEKTVSTIAYGIPFAIALLAAAGFVVTQNISNPLKEISASATRIASGDLSMQLAPSTRTDEVGAVTRTFARMTQSLQEMANVADRMAKGDLSITVKPQSEKDVLGNALAAMIENLRRVTQEIHEGANVLASAASEIVASTTQLAASVSETAAAVTETSSTVEEIKRTAEVSSDKAGYVSETAKKTAQVSESGRRSVEQTLEGINLVRQQVDAITESIMKLSDQSQAIGEIIATVNDLAEQSKVLAVNAAIEAAKAEDEGKGFAVVAQEIKSLAEQSKQATAQVRGILGEIQKATAAAVLAAEQGGKAVDAGVKQSAEAGEAIKLLAHSIAEAAQAATQIAASSQQQRVGMDQVASAMQNIQQASTQSAAGTKQAETAAHNLNDLGQKLKTVVGQYRL